MICFDPFNICLWLPCFAEGIEPSTQVPRRARIICRSVLHVAVLPVQLTNELLADQHVVVGPTVMAIVVVQLHGHDGTTVDHLILVDGGGTVISTSIF